MDEESARVELLRLFRTSLPDELAESDSFSDLLSQHIPLGTLTDVIAYAINFPASIKHTLLAEHRVEVRYQLLVEQLALWVQSNKSSSPAQEKIPRALDGFAPPFSAN